ncbi:hypothetical protein HY339_02530 [Candidatus Gottesmanbacteria bacterium]|nr:hypothetical protein [Candidatus Gottesmanbacteria bacterium]
MLPSYFVIIGAVIGSIGALWYLVDTIRGTVKPNRVSFLLWSIAPLIAFTAEVQKGVGIQSLMTFSVGFLPLLIFLASFVNKKAEWKITRFDLTCGALSLLALILWLITKEGNIAILLSIAADGLAAVPTIVKAYHHPETEVGWIWLAAAINGLLTLLTVTDWTLAHYGFPLYILLVDLTIYAPIQFELKKRIGRIRAIV